jgi:hypothetical protein
MATNPSYIAERPARCSYPASIPLLLEVISVMAGYTMTSLWIPAQPIVQD